MKLKKESFLCGHGKKWSGAAAATHPKELMEAGVVRGIRPAASCVNDAGERLGGSRYIGTRRDARGVRALPAVADAAPGGVFFRRRPITSSSANTSANRTNRLQVVGKRFRIGLLHKPWLRI